VKWLIAVEAAISAARWLRQEVAVFRLSLMRVISARSAMT